MKNSQALGATKEFIAFRKQIPTSQAIAFLDSLHPLAVRIRFLALVCSHWPYDCDPPWGIMGSVLDEIRKELKKNDL